MIEKYRFKLLFGFTLLFLIMPAYFSKSFLFNPLMLISLTFVFFQSVRVTTKRTRKSGLLIILAIIVLSVTWFRLLTRENVLLDTVSFLLITGFFIIIVVMLLRFIVSSTRITDDVITVSIVIYLFFGMIGGCLAFLIHNVYPGSYNLPDQMDPPNLMGMIYYSFVTMSTLGYGDITPVRPESQTLAFLLAVTGQLYVAIAIALLVGKYITHEKSYEDKVPEKKEKNK